MVDWLLRDAAEKTLKLDEKDILVNDMIIGY
jgi:hypothetical protein